MPYADAAGTRIYWEEEGAGDPLLLVMGLGYPLEMWYRIRPGLARRFRLILVDNRGAGRSGVPPSPYSIGQMAGDARTVLEAAGVASAHVLGISLGGLVAQELALTYPERVRSLVLGCTHHGGPDAVPAQPEVVTALLSRADLPPEAGVRLMIPYIYDPATPRERVEEDIAIRLRHYPTSEGYVAQLEAALSFESRARLGRIAVPTLVIHGESDRLVPPGNGSQLARAIPGAELVLLAKASHIFWTDQPEGAEVAILTFLERVAARGWRPESE